MANYKTGLSYYNVDTDRYQDMKIKRLKKGFGCSGMAVYDYVLCQIYRDRGCFLVWDENTAFDVAEYFGVKENTVNEIVQYCGVVGLFNRELLTRGIVSSLTIQNRYLDMCNRAKRVNVLIPENVKITEECKIITEVPTKITEECEKTTKVCDKVKYSIVKYSKEKEKSPNGDKKKNPDFEKFESWIKSNAPYCANPAHLQQLTEVEFLKLKEKYKSEQIADTIQQIENRKDLRKKYTNLYRTLLNWLKTNYDEK